MTISLITCASVALAGFCYLCNGGVARAAESVPGDPLSGSGAVSRSANGYASLMSSVQPAALANESNFGLPPNAAVATDRFEGTLALAPTSARYFRVFYDQLNQTSNGHNIAPFATLPPFSFQFVQNGSYLIPVIQGLAITGSATWNYIIGPGRVWSEASDRGYSRAAFPVALVQRNQNCVHNGAVTFLFDKNASSNISHAAYQFTGEGCPSFMFDMAGQVAASYSPNSVANAAALENAEAAEVAHRLPVRPFSALAIDFPDSGINPTDFLRQYVYPNSVTTYGLVIKGVNYNSGCATRHTAAGLGEYPFCSEMRMPSYSTAKSVFSSLAMMWLGQLYGGGVYSALISSWVPQYMRGGTWTNVTFGNASDMATGNFLSSAYESDENGAATAAFLDAEAFAEKIAGAFAAFTHKAAPGTTWVYQSVASFIVTQGMNAYLKRAQGAAADLFEMMSSSTCRPLLTSQGFQSTVRTDNSAVGAPSGYYGIFYNIDDIAKIGQFVDAGAGTINGSQILDGTRLKEALFRTADPGLAVPDTGSPRFKNTWVYNHNFWGKKITREEFPSISCQFTIPLMSGYGGNTIMPLPNGATYYVFSDAFEFPINAAISQINSLAGYCP